MEEIYGIRISNPLSGLTNQFFSFTTGITFAIHYGKRIVVIDNLLTDYKTDNYISFSQVVNLNSLNALFKKNNINITVYDKDYFDYNLKQVEYGINTNKIDITQEVMQKYYSNNRLLVPKNLDLNTIKCDPIGGVIKNLFVTFTINDKDFTYTYPENRNNDISLIFTKDIYYNYTFGGLNNCYRKIVETIVTNLEYTDRYNDIANNFVKKLDSNKVNVIHLRLEDDAIKHWSGFSNRLPFDQFKDKLCKKYIGLITKYFDKSDNNIILTYNIDNDVIKFMKDNGYKYYFVDKQVDMGRELNAIIDIIISRSCNNIFIGNYNLDKLTGSTFSYYVHTQVKKNNAKTIMIDLQDLGVDEKIL